MNYDSWFKSSFSAGHNCVEGRWVKSTFSGSQGGNCVETFRSPDSISIRNSRVPDVELPPFTRDEWKAFTDGVKAGEFDIPA